MAVKRFNQKQTQQNQAAVTNQAKNGTGKTQASTPVINTSAGKTDNTISGGGSFLAANQPVEPQKIENNTPAPSYQTTQKIDNPPNTIYNPSAPQKTDTSNNGFPTALDNTSKTDVAMPEGSGFSLENHLDNYKPRANENPTERTQRYNNILQAFIDNPIRTGNDLLDTLLGDRQHKRPFQNYYFDTYEDTDVRPYSNPNFDYDTSGNGVTPYTPTYARDSQKTDASALGLDGSSASSMSSTNNNYGGGSGGRGGVGGTAAYENGYDLNSLYDLLNARLNEYNNQYGSLMESLLGAYNTNNANLDDYYQAMMNTLGLDYSDTEALLRSQLAKNQQAVEDERRRAMQEAYISRMLAEKRLGEQLDAYGLTGGASESVMSGLLNSYLNNRNSVEEKTQSSLADLLENFLTNLNSARQNYNSGLMSAAQNRLNARQQLANNLASSQADAANYLANARSGAYEDLFNTLARLYT